jgi:DNA-binding LytR/AlgR family response regulator
VVIGPYPTDEAALTTLDASRPDAVIVDINLGSGPSFKLAEVLRDRGIPFLFVTGYDQGAIPARFKDVERLEKPIQLRRVVEVVAKLSERAT